MLYLTVKRYTPKVQVAHTKMAEQKKDGSDEKE